MPQTILRTFIGETISFDFDEDDNYFQLMGKIYSAIPDKYKEKNLNIVIGTKGKIMTRENFEDFKESELNYLIFRVKKRIRLVTDQINLSSYYDLLNEYMIDNLLNKGIDIVLERDNGKITLSLDGDFINIKVNLEDIKLTFTVEKDDIIDQLIDQVR